MKNVNQGSSADRPMMYQIKVQGRLNESWSHWFNGIAITCEGSVTTLTGIIVDQAALRGILSKIWDLNLQLISVTHREIEQKAT